MTLFGVCVLALTLTSCWCDGGQEVEEVIKGHYTWAVELISDDMSVARGVARDLGIHVVGKMFTNVFIVNGTNIYTDKDHDQIQKLHGTMNVPQKLNHPLIVWSERQDGHQRRSGNTRMDINQQHRVTGTGYTNNIINRGSPYVRQSRDIGGLDREPPESPWDHPKTIDPLRWRQWYLEEGSGVHLNVTGLWEAGVRGAGISVAILDDGVELTHLDLALNYDPAASWDLLDADPDPTPLSWSRHGTQLAGIIAATHSNGLCGMGVAPWAGVGAVRMLGYMVWDITEAAALSYERDHVGVYVAAWGPVDTGAVMEGPGVMAGRAIKESIVFGRKGLGSIYVWASGNGGLVGDDCNADGYTNSLFTLTVSGSTYGGQPPNYAETCAATFVSTYSGDAEENKSDDEEQVRGIVTTDTGGICTETFRGSSVSAAMVAGVCALALGVNPRLSWRDIQHLMVRAANPHNPLPSQWHVNGVGLQYSYYFGFGSLDGGRMVDLARTWRSVPPAFRCQLEAPHRDVPLTPDKSINLTLSVAGCQVVQLEHVQVNLSISARNRGQVEVVLESPLGTVSTLLSRRPLDLSPYGIHNHPLMTVHMWGEDPRGIWKLRLKYYGEGILGPFGSKRLVKTPNLLHNWTLILHGTEVPLNQATYHHYYFNATQLSRANRRKTSVPHHPRRVRKPQNPEKYQDKGITIAVKHWSSPKVSSDIFLSYLYCRVKNADPSSVINLGWHTSEGGPVDGVMRRLRGRGAQSSRYPVLLLVREARTFEGNFTCKFLYNGEEFAQNIEIKDHHSNVPLVTKMTQVSVPGGTVRMPCDILVPILRGSWSLDGHRLRPSEGRIIVSEESLTINNVSKEDLGEYKCHLRSPRLSFSHSVIITLLQAAGPTTLIAHYNLTPLSSTTLPQGLPGNSSTLCTATTTPTTATTTTNSTTEPQVPPPPPPPPTTTTTITTTKTPISPTTTTPITTPVSHSGINRDSGPWVDTTKRCPPPYKLLGEFCILVAPGEARSWQRARSQCLSMGGDLMIVKNATFLLTLMRYFHTQVSESHTVSLPDDTPQLVQGVRQTLRRLRTCRLTLVISSRHDHLLHVDLANNNNNKSFWLGGVVRWGGATDWRWLDDTNLDTRGPMWWSTSPRHRLHYQQQQQVPSNTRRIHNASRRQRPTTTTTVALGRKRGHRYKQVTQQSPSSTTTTTTRDSEATRGHRSLLPPPPRPPGTHLVSSGGQPRRAVCLLAKFRHFFSSCSVSDRLTALCQLKSSS
ncbi:hypothetical protein Pmani_027042 [Petrolisthes manimaculis]|uniref:P/Homo B domain-containing protein n=1 Tax=Petrolisthes manimaculis TaxID=1843537 RepID=A0AAE1P4G9_9EUCA|nr:hypothetical protein Pmani_027042 [Petrolisthes manimaculis]